MTQSKVTPLTILGTLGVLLLGAGIATSSETAFLIQVTENPDLVHLASIMALFLFLVVVNEQVCDVITSAIFGNEKRMFETKTGPETALVPDHSKARVSKVICILFGLAVAASGFQFLTLTTTALGVENLISGANESTQWRYVDTLMTALVLAGGADRFHKIAKVVFPKDTKVIPADDTVAS